MEDLIRLFSTSKGDIYHITLSEDATFLSEEIKKYIESANYD